jgi:hypothetical protein
MGLQPKNASRGGRIDAGLVPPGGFVARTMYLTVMSAAQRNRELIADLASKGQ